MHAARSDRRSRLLHEPKVSSAVDLEEIAREQQGRLRVGKIDIDACPEVAAQLGVRGAPTVVLFRGGREQGRLLGLTSKRKLLELAALGDAPVQLPVR